MRPLAPRPSSRCIVGALSEGAIIESGNNPNGYWCKLADGTLIMYGDYTQTNVDVTTVNNGWYRGTVDITLPHVLVSATSVLASAGQNYGWGAVKPMMLAGIKDVSTLGVMIFAPISTTINAYLQWGVVGRWKA